MRVLLENGLETGDDTAKSERQHTKHRSKRKKPNERDRTERRLNRSFGSFASRSQHQDDPYRHCEGEERNSCDGIAKVAISDQVNEEWPQQIELLFDCERPGVLQQVGRAIE